MIVELPREGVLNNYLTFSIYSGISLLLYLQNYQKTFSYTNILQKNNLLNTDTTEAKHRFYVSDGAEQFKAFANKILTCHVEEIRDINNIESYI